MQFSNKVLIGMVSLAGTITTIAANDKYDVVKRSFTTVRGGCTAVCKDNLLNDCTVKCDPAPTQTAVAADGKDLPPNEIAFTTEIETDCTKVCFAGDFLICTPTTCASKPTPKPILKERGVVTVTNNGCTAVCQEIMAASECDINCGTDFSTHMIRPTPKPTAAPAVQKRGFTTTSGDCTAVCWDDFPGTGCDVQCHKSGITKMPASTSGVAPLWKTTFTQDDCTVTCQDLNPGSECGFRCSKAFPTQIPVPTKVARAAMIEARADVQARQAHEARLERKFGLEARDKCETVTVTVTSVPAYCSKYLAFLPEVVSESSGIPMASAALSAASVAIFEAATAASSETALPPGASAALSEAESFLSSVSQAGISRASTDVTTSAVITTPTLTATATTTATGTTTTASTKTALTTAASTTTASTTTGTTSTAETPSPSEQAIPSGTRAGDATMKNPGFSGTLMVLVAGLVGNVAFMI